MSERAASSPEGKRWESKYSDPSFMPDETPSPRLVLAMPTLPRGRALDVAAGLGRHSRFLAENGYHVDAVDVSGSAVAMLHLVGHLGRLEIWPVQALIEEWRPEGDVYQLIVNTLFLDRSISPMLAAALAPGGVLFFETWNAGHLSYKPDFNRAFLLEPGELRTLFPSLQVIEYSETDTGSESFSTLLARRV